MVGKIKKHGQACSPHAGFLKPTLAYQRRCATKQSGNHQKSKRKGRKSKAEANQKNNLSWNKSPMQETGSRLFSAVEMYGRVTPPKADGNDQEIALNSTFITKSQFDKNEETLIEARKMCDTLKEQIQELRTHQENFDEHMRSMKPDVSMSHGHNSVRVDGLNNSKVKAQILSSNTASAKKNENHTENSVGYPLHPNSIIRVNVQPKQQPLLDTSNIHKNVENPPVTNTPESIIRKLHTERDKYKRRVLKLQTELKIVKRNKEKLLKSPEIMLNDLCFYNADMVGEGRIANVYEGTLHGKAVAVKKLVRPGLMTASDRSYLAAEAGLLVLLQHRNIVRVMGVCTAPMEPLIVTEFVHGKTVLDMVTRAGGGLDPASLFSITRDVALGMAYLHTQKPPILHLNLRPSNVLVDPYSRAKVADFGFSKIRLDAGVSNASNLAYLAPELMRYPAHLTIKTDVFAFAILLWQMTTGEDPMQGRTTSEVLDMIQTGKRLDFPETLPQSMQLLIEKCWDSSPMQRPAFKEVILLLETMPLPDYWMLKLKENGVSRMDMSDLGSTTHDSVDSLGSAAPADLPQKLGSSRPHVQQSKIDAVTRENLVEAPKLTNLDAKTAPSHPDMKPQLNLLSANADDKLLSNSMLSRNQHDVPLPCDQVRYVSHNLQQEISTPEVVRYNRKIPPLLHDMDQLRPHIPASKHLQTSTKLSQHNYVYELASPHAGVQHRSSKFDHKFRDFVTDACQAESNSRVHASSVSHLIHERLDFGSKPSVSTDYIRVHSLSTLPESIATSAGKSNTGSNDTALYPNPLCDYSVKPSAHFYTKPPNTDVRVCTPPTDPSLDYLLSQKLAEAKLQSDLSKSNSVLTNAKRLLLTSPLRQQYKSTYEPSSYYPGKYNSAPCNGVTSQNYKHSAQLDEPASKPLSQLYSQSLASFSRGPASKSSTGSSESYHPLPPDIPTNRYSVFSGNLNRASNEISAWGDFDHSRPQAETQMKPHQVHQHEDNASQTDKLAIDWTTAFSLSISLSGC
ncbi:uncharacterized protein LOC143462960 isoform X2 [Clavelina lepadiformis]|uniref:uncharacterized protein LOC143462960 isoform X2 n=1 Tax=Clavelina lepadiformis TaxID=159417 RepID=UPI004042E0FF